jgi:diguanylate cyclase (GGDEF)-like protein/putative nucleotidyltransferase with HDIG domain
MRTWADAAGGVVEEQTAEYVRDERRSFFKRLAWYRRRVESLEAQAVLDDLTGLRNQRALWRELTRRGAASSAESPLSVVMLDFDMFKEVNERYGHEVGDAVLRRAATVLRESAPSPRLAFRYGGEEFVLVVPGDEEDGRMLAEEVRLQVSQLNGRLPAVTISCGVAQFDRPVEPWLALDRADAALRAAKRSGRNRVVVSGRSQPTGNPYLVEELEHETARRAALALAMATLEVRDRQTADHSDDVLTLCESIGRRLGLAVSDLEQLVAGAQLHDVGKVAVPLEILNKPGPLNQTEWAVIREHTVIGERILRSVPEMAEVATIVRHSHEHWDGTGYPDGLKGEQIPLASRIILCADAFHAIRSDRPYRGGRPADEAIAELRACAGTQLDPDVVAALANVADDLRSQKSNGTVATAIPRNRRLIALLAALMIGGTSAVAGIPELRDAVKSIFGVVAAEPSEPAALNPDATFGFGPLGDVLSIAPTAAVDRRNGTPTVVPRSVAVADRRGRAGGGRQDSGGAFEAPSSPRGGGTRSPLSQNARPPKAKAPTRNQESAPSPKATPQPAPVESVGTTGGDPPSGGGTPTGGGNGESPATSGESHGQGRALGKTLPTPRPPAQQPSQNRPPEGGPPQPPGRTDPPAIGRNTLATIPDLGAGNEKGSSKKP